MWLLGFSLDNLSLMALTLSVGFVVDDAIVMLENIVRHMEQGKPPLRAALDGSQEIAFTIVSMTISLVGRVHPDPVHGRHRRAAAARVRGHDRRGDPGLGRRLAVADAAPVQPLPAHRSTATAAPTRWTTLVRARLRGRPARLRAHARARAAPPARGAGALRRLAGRDRLGLPRDPEGLPPERGHRASCSASPRPPRASRSRRWPSTRRRSPQRSDAIRRSRRPSRRSARADPNASVNTGRDLRRSEAARRARRQRRPGDRAAAARARRDSGHPRLHAEPAADPHRRSAHQEPVPARAPGPRYRGRSTAAPRTCSSGCARCPSCAT